VQDCQVHPALTLFNKGDTKSWVTAVGRAGSKQDQRKNAGIILFFWRFIWKEQNQRIFYHKESSFLQVAFLIKEALSSYHRAIASVYTAFVSLLRRCWNGL
jgi:hypothetical protein